MAVETFPDSEDEMTPEQLQRFYAAKSKALLEGDSDAYYALVNRSISKKAAEPTVKPAKQKAEESKNDAVKSN